MTRKYDGVPVLCWLPGQYAAVANCHDWDKLETPAIVCELNMVAKPNFRK